MTDATTTTKGGTKPAHAQQPSVAMVRKTEDIAQQKSAGHAKADPLAIHPLEAAAPLVLVAAVIAFYFK